VIWVMHTLGGGCGSGLGSRLLERLAEEMPNVPRVSIAVLPSDKVSDSVTQTYNAGWALSHILPAANQMLCIDITQLDDICFRGGIAAPTFANLNELISLEPDREAPPWHERNADDVAPELQVVSLAAWPHTFSRDQETRSMPDSTMATGLASDALSTLASSSGGQWIKMLGVLSGPGQRRRSATRPSMAQPAVRLRPAAIPVFPPHSRICTANSARSSAKKPACIGTRRKAWTSRISTPQQTS
jgi:hypothetical protein